MTTTFEDIVILAALVAIFAWVCSIPGEVAEIESSASTVTPADPVENVSPAETQDDTMHVVTASRTYRVELPITDMTRPRIYITNNMSASDPTYDELITFLENDQTDKIEYVDPDFVCTDYAWIVHDNAEKAGIRAGVVSITFQGEEYGHACNAFNTVDQGLVYVDCTAPAGENYVPGMDNDATVQIQDGQEYAPYALFSYAGYDSQCPSMGTVTDYSVTW